MTPLTSPSRTPTPARSQAFANGYYIGELLSIWNLQPDFDKFQKSDEPAAAVSNFKRLQVRANRRPQLRILLGSEESRAVALSKSSLADPAACEPLTDRRALTRASPACVLSQPTLLRLGINLDALVASKIIAKERGAASKLIYRIKTAVEGLSRDLQSARRTGKLAKTLVRHILHPHHAAASAGFRVCVSSSPHSSAIRTAGRLYTRESSHHLF